MLWAETIPRKTLVLDGGGTAALTLYVGTFDGMERPRRQEGADAGARDIAGARGFEEADEL